MPKRVYSAPDSAQRLAELEAAIAELHQRQAAQPKGQAGFARRARLAVLIEAFNRRRDLVAAGLDDVIDGASAAPVNSKRREKGQEVRDVR